MKRTWYCFLPLALLALSGCGSTTATGTVTLDNSPVDGGAILFIPIEEAGGSRPTVGGEIIDGKYTLLGAKGLATGKYRVRITWNKKTGRKVTVPGDNTVQMDETVQSIPGKYNTESTLEADVKSSGSNVFDFPLKSR
jgi:hypothetical protein